MRLLPLLIQNLQLQTAFSITHAAANLLRVVRSPEGADSQHHDHHTEHQSGNGSRYCDSHDCSSQIVARSRIPILTNEAASLWERLGITGPPEYWQLTADTSRESRAQEFFLEWMDRYQGGAYKDECGNGNYTAIQCFASMWWGDHDFRCTIDQIQRCQVPTAHAVAHWIGKRHHDWPAFQVTDTARKVYFVYKRFQIVVADLRTDWDIIPRMGTAVALEAHLNIDKFTPQHDKVRNSRCQLVQNVAEIAVDSMIMAGIIGLNAAQFSGYLARMALKSEKLMVTAKETGDYKQAVRSAQQLNLVRNSLYYTQWAAGQLRKGYNSGQDVTDARQNAKGAKIPERTRPRLEFPHIKNHGFCGNIFGVVDDNSASQGDQLVLFINDQLHTLRYTAEQIFSSFFIKEQEDLGDVALIDIMKTKEWPGHSTRSYEDLETHVKSAVRNTMLSELLAASRQYLKCEERDDAEEACNRDKQLAPDKRLSLYCPSKYPRLRCQAAFWTKKQVFNHEKVLPGLKGGDGFSSSGIDLSSLYSNSIERYYVMGLDSYSSRGLYENGNVADAAKMAHLPVTVSKVRTVNPGSHRDYPYSCGDWTSNCTTAFLERINVNINDEYEVRHVSLQDHLKLIPEPANRFLLLCHLKIHWPTQGEMIGLKNSGPSQICGAVREEIEHMDELEGNYRFCNMDIVRKHVFEQELRGGIALMLRPPCHRKLCDRWLSDNSTKLKERFGPDAITIA